MEEYARTIKEAEAEILKTKEKIKELQDALDLQIKELDEKIKEKYVYQEKCFLKEYGVSAQSIRAEYIKLIIGSSKSLGGEGYNIIGVPELEQFTIKKRSGHVHIPPKHLKVCKPTPLVYEAFATIGQTPKIKRINACWGN
jgi:hypothetical protein